MRWARDQAIHHASGVMAVERGSPMSPLPTPKTLVMSLLGVFAVSTVDAADHRPALIPRQPSALPGARHCSPTDFISTTHLDGSLSRTQLLAAADPNWSARLREWAEANVSAPWFPWLLATIGFLDPFLMCGFLLTPMLSLALIPADPVWAAVLCLSASGGCLLGGVAFTKLIGRLDVASKLQGSQALAVARELLQKHGVVAGLLNTILPLPVIPLLVAAQVAGTQVPLILIMMSLGRLTRYVCVYAAILASRAAYRSSTSWRAKGGPETSAHTRSRRFA